MWKIIQIHHLNSGLGVLDALQPRRLYRLAQPPVLKDLKAIPSLKKEVGLIIHQPIWEQEAGRVCFLIVGDDSELPLPDFFDFKKIKTVTSAPHLHPFNLQDPLHFLHSTDDFEWTKDVYPPRSSEKLSTAYVISRSGLVQAQLFEDYFRYLAALKNPHNQLHRKICYRTFSGPDKGATRFFDLPVEVPTCFESRDRSTNQTAYNLTITEFLKAAFGPEWQNQPLQTFWLKWLPSLYAPEMTESITFIDWPTAERVFGRQTVFEIFNPIFSWSEILVRFG